MSKQNTNNASELAKLDNILLNGMAKTNVAKQSEVSASGMSIRAFQAQGNDGSKEKNFTRPDALSAKADMFMIIEGRNIRDNGFPNGVDPQKAARYARKFIKGTLPQDPLKVEQVIDENDNVRLAIIDGHNTYTGAMMAQEVTGKEYFLPYAIVKIKKDGDEILAMLDSDDRFSFTPLDKAQAYIRLVDLGWTAKDIAEYHDDPKVTALTVENHIRLADLPREFKQALLDKNISMSRLLKLLDSHPRLEDAYAVIALELEGQVQANEEAKAKTGLETNRLRRDNPNRTKKPTAKLVESMSSTVSTVANAIAEKTGYASVDDLPSNDEEEISITLPVSLIRKLLLDGDSLTDIEVHNSNVEAAIAKKKQEMKAEKVK